MAENNEKFEKFPGEVAKREKRKVRSRRRGDGSVWFGLGMFGMVGWAVAIPTVIATFVGIWIDIRWPSRYSWTLMLLVLGLGSGCFNAWYWVQKERSAINRERGNSYE